MKVATLLDLYISQLQDMHSCERQLIKALPKMVKAAVHPDLRDAFNEHLEVTRGQLERLTKLLGGLEKTAGRQVCEATVGLIKEAGEIMEDTAGGDAVDAGLICAAQKIEHYEIASYRCLKSFATMLGRAADAKLLDKTLSEEKTADETLSELLSAVSTQAAA